MTTRAKVAVLRTQPKTVLEDYQRLCDLAGMAEALDPGATTILKDNISWHYPMPSANTTPWQLEGTILALLGAGFEDVVCIENQTLVTRASKGERLNGYAPVFEHYGIPVLYNFRREHMTWELYEPQAEMLVLRRLVLKV